MTETPRYRVEKTHSGFWPYCVRCGTGNRQLFVGHRKACLKVAAELTTAFNDGAYMTTSGARLADTERLERLREGLRHLGADLASEAHHLRVMPHPCDKRVAMAIERKGKDIRRLLARSETDGAEDGAEKET